MNREMCPECGRPMIAFAHPTVTDAYRIRRHRECALAVELRRVEEERHDG